MLKRIVKNERVSGLHEIVVHISLSPDEFQECGQISVNLNLLLHEGGEPLLREDAESVRDGLRLSCICRDFVSFAGGYTRSDYRVVRSCARWFERFCMEEGCGECVLTRELCEDYRDFLYEHLHGNTPGNYFKKWRQYLDRLVDEGRLSANPALSVRLHYYDYRPKEVLTRGELLQLFSSPCSHPEVKRAFLFSCLCGLRWCDIKQLRVDDVDYQRQLLSITQQKVRGSSSHARLRTFLNKSAMCLIAERRGESGPMFNLPSYAMAYRIIKEWAAGSGIDKHLSFHCARHTFISLLIAGGVDIKTVADLAGHSSTRHTERYVHSQDEHLRDSVSVIDLGEICRGDAVYHGE